MQRHQWLGNINGRFAYALPEGVEDGYQPHFQTAGKLKTGVTTMNIGTEECRLSVDCRWTGCHLRHLVASDSQFSENNSNAHLHIEPWLERRHVVHPLGERDSLGLHLDRVDFEVRQQELRHDRAGGHTRPGCPKQVGDGVDLSVLAPGDVKSLERWKTLQVLCSTFERRRTEGARIT